VELIRLARVVRESQPLLRLYGPIRSATSAFLVVCKEDCVALQSTVPGSYDRSLHHLKALTGLLQKEHRLALDALAALERFRCGDGAGSSGNECGVAHFLPRRRPLQTIGVAAVQTGLSRDRIINWERNGLCRYRRSAAGYRLFGTQELDRLLIIRSCRTAGYSITSIRRLLCAIDSETTPAEFSPSGDLPPEGQPTSGNVPLRTIADTPTLHERELFPLFPTDTLPATLEAMIALAARLHALLESPPGEPRPTRPAEVLTNTVPSA
jgi:DNA-binding transcriptional MerR regulator